MREQIRTIMKLVVMVRLSVDYQINFDDHNQNQKVRFHVIIKFAFCRVNARLVIHKV